MMGRIITTAALSAGLIASAAAVALAQETNQDVVAQSQWYLAPAAEPEPLALPSAVTSSAWHAGSTVETGLVGDYWVGGTISLGEWSDPTKLAIGDQASQSAFASGFLALSGGIWGITPYVGAGVGASPTTTPALGLQSSASSWSLAYEGVAGFSVSWTPMLTTELEYRYFTADELAAAPGPGADSYQSHDVMLRIDLGF